MTSLPFPVRQTCHPPSLGCFCRRVEWMVLSSLLILLINISNRREAFASQPLFTEFAGDSRRVFNLSSSAFYHSLFVDSHNHNVLFLGGLDYMYKLDANNISNYNMSVNLTDSNGFSDQAAQNVEKCWRQYHDLKNKSMQCRSHVRTIYRVVDSNEIYVCATGAYYPQEFYLNEQLSVIAVPEADTEGSSGRRKCPYDPYSVYVFTYVTKGNPHSVPATYTGVPTSSYSNDVHLIRPPLRVNRTNHTSIGNSLRTDTDTKWINTEEAVYVVAVFDIGDHVYYFFRELALESSPFCGKTYYSRVGRVCKQDQGGKGLGMEHRFTTFLKARLTCSVITPPSTVPYFFNEVYDVQYNNDTSLFHVLFLANSDCKWGSAVCSFALADINNVFDNGDFLERPNLESAWIRTPPQNVPQPRPGQCGSDSQQFVTSTLIFIKSHTLMADHISPTGGQPRYYSKEFSFTKMKVDQVSNYDVLYLYLSDQAEIRQVVLWTNDSEPQFWTLSKWRPFANLQAARSTSLPTPVWSMLLHTVQQTRWLYLTAEFAVVQLNTQLCQFYTKCTDCIRDPHCGWHTATRRCQQFQPGLIQDVKSSDALKVCSQNSACTTVNTWNQVIPGMSLHLNCSSPCLPDGATVTWSLQPNYTSEVVYLQTNVAADYVLSADNSLVVLNVNESQHVGIFQCSYNNHILAEHTVNVSACRYGDWDVWLHEYQNYCRVFDSYYANYKKWDCVLNRCMDRPTQCDDAAIKMCNS